MKEEEPPPPPPKVESDPQLVGSPGEEDAAPSTVSQIAIDNLHGGPTFVGCQVTIFGDVVATEGGERVPLHAFDLTDHTASTAGAFATPKFYDGLVRTIAAHRVAVLHGPGSGRGTAATAALHNSEHRPVLLLALDLSPETLVRAVERICRSGESPTAGILVEDIESTKLVTLLVRLRRRLLAALGEDGALIFTANVPEPESSGLPTELLVACEPPPGIAVAKKLFRKDDGPIEPAVRDALERLGDPIAPATVTALLETARRSRAPGDRLAEQFASRATDALLREWFATARAPRELAALTAAAVLDGETTADVDAQARELCRRLDPDPAAPAATGDEPARRVFGLADRGWPPGLAQIARGQVHVHYGLQDAEIVELCRPHTRERVLRFLWNEVDPSFRPVLVAWIRDLPSQAGRLRFGAAAAAGILFALESTVAEQHILRPWALNGRVLLRSCVADALGVATLSSRDATVARALAHHWGTLSDLRLRQVAIMAYGGLLGAWDPAADAATHLWRIGEQSPELTPWTDAALADLVAAGGRAGRARAAVITVLAVRSDDKRTRLRTFALLPLLVDRLTGPRPDARASLDGLLGPAEQETLKTFGVVLSRALRTASPGRGQAQRALLRVLDAEVRGRASEDAAADVIRAMQAGTPVEDRVPVERRKRTRLDRRVQRILTLEVRHDTPRAELAAKLLLMFFPSNQAELKEAS